MTVATRLVVIYAKRSKILRRKIIVDDESQLGLHQPGPGESLLPLPVSAPFDDASCRAAIAAATGAEPLTVRCCIIDAHGDVVGVCNADPALDNPVAEASSLAPKSRYEIGDTVCRKDVASARP